MMTTLNKYHFKQITVLVNLWISSVSSVKSFHQIRHKLKQIHKNHFSFFSTSPPLLQINEKNSVMFFFLFFFVEKQAEKTEMRSAYFYAKLRPFMVCGYHAIADENDILRRIFIFTMHSAHHFSRSASISNRN